MNTPLRTRASRCVGLLVLLTGAPALLHAQEAPPVIHPADSVTKAAGAHYRAGGFHRSLFGGTYRDLWTTPIRVPVLDLRGFRGGLDLGKEGGGNQTKSLRFTTSDDAEYVFRSVDKDRTEAPKALSGIPFVERLARDQVSSSHPAANLMVPPLLEAAGVLHENAVMVAMPDDSLLGKFRKVYAKRLGGFGRYPSEGHYPGGGFGKALDIIDSDSLLRLLNRDPTVRVDAPAFLAARLVDMLVNNWDRHPGQWKWARTSSAAGAMWEPISRDYDKAFVSVSGFLPKIGRAASANLMVFDSSYAGMRGLTWNSVDFDHRLLDGLDRTTWDSVATALARRLTDPVIASVAAAMPREYQATAPALTARLRMRRDSLPMVADHFYDYLAGVVNIHATDAADHAIVTRVDAATVAVELRGPDEVPYFSRRFHANETTAIRLYLHGGDDHADITGDVPSSIPLWVIGGNGNNTLVDASHVAGHDGTVHLYDQGAVHDVEYGKDTLFNRRPLVGRPGHLMPASRDQGHKMSPILGLSINHDYGIQPRLGMAWYNYGFRQEPYSRMVALEGRYSLKVRGASVALTVDQRHEASPYHLTALARMSQLEMVNYHGLGNESPQSPGVVTGVSAPRDDFYAIQQRQWLFRPAVAKTLGRTTELSFGPVLQYSVTDSTPDRAISAVVPYGAGKFGEAGLRLSLSHVDRLPKRHPHRGTELDLTGTYFPAVWDVRSGFGSVSAAGGVYVTVPMPLHPYLGLRAGGKKVFGDFPFQESAFIGGRGDVRTLDLQRYAGDASVYATAELRVPVAKFTLLLPLNVGLLGTGDIGRVYVDGKSPGGWHNAIGTGFWVAFHELSLDVRVLRANETGKSSVIALRLTHFGVLP
ncbi:MAG: hypothetical protein ABJC19_05635 [Gemmatimonadota bacterium]